ncbi:MAG: cellulase family glycosylhydrolase [Candidatus Brocadiaceae bacterium]|jgi:endoglucanase
MNRRDFLRAALAAGAGLAVRPTPAAKAAPAEVSASKLPRWRGFNLLSKFMVWRNEPFVEDDFRIMHEWGFDFARLPMDYRCWTDRANPRRLRQDVLAEVDEAVEYGLEHDVHVCINFHRAPGYTVARPPEEKSVWTDAEARQLCVLHWGEFARRHAGVPPERLSFNLFNEPARIGSRGFSLQRYREVVRMLTDAIREHDPNRLIICDGYEWGTKPAPTLTDLGVAQSTRAYQPFWLTHYGASWVGGENWAEPEWPARGWDIDRLREYWRPWKELADSGVGVHCGEGGAYNAVPHATFLRWLEDALTVLEQYGIGWAIWNLRGPFGPLDAGREDVEYDAFDGHELDRDMLRVLLRH